MSLDSPVCPKPPQCLKFKFKFNSSMPARDEHGSQIHASDWSAGPNPDLWLVCGTTMLMSGACTCSLHLPVKSVTAVESNLWNVVPVWYCINMTLEWPQSYLSQLVMIWWFSRVVSSSCHHLLPRADMLTKLVRNTSVL